MHADDPLAFLRECAELLESPIPALEEIELPGKLDTPITAIAGRMELEQITYSSGYVHREGRHDAARPAKSIGTFVAGPPIALQQVDPGLLAWCGNCAAQGGGRAEGNEPEFERMVPRVAAGPLHHKEDNADVPWYVLLCCWCYYLSSATCSSI